MSWASSHSKLEARDEAKVLEAWGGNGMPSLDV
jgi:hypothetical protein